VVKIVQGGDLFCVVETRDFFPPLGEEGEGTDRHYSVQFWALVKPDVKENKVVVSLYHPPASKTAGMKEDIIARITESMLQTCHVVNQLLLLRGIYMYAR
jgi:hypothetical protein